MADYIWLESSSFYSDKSYEELSEFITLFGLELRKGDRYYPEVSKDEYDVFEQYCLEDHGAGRFQIAMCDGEFNQRFHSERLLCHFIQEVMRPGSEAWMTFSSENPDVSAAPWGYYITKDAIYSTSYQEYVDGMNISLNAMRESETSPMEPGKVVDFRCAQVRIPETDFVKHSVLEDGCVFNHKSDSEYIIFIGTTQEELETEKKHYHHWKEVTTAMDEAFKKGYNYLCILC
jgi:hypothetical protein